MPGTYAHITAVHFARSRAERYGLSAETEYAIGLWLGYLELGALSPDFPYLSLTKSHCAWADCMHWNRTSQFLINSTDLISELSDIDHQKAVAWLFGFSAHMALDATIHPVIEEMVGPYEHNKTNHRLCEMHQDVYIFPRLDLGEVSSTDHLKFGVGRCIDNNTGMLDTTIRSLWSTALQKTHAHLASENAPAPARWHKDFVRILRSIRKLDSHFAFARHVAAKKALSFPTDPCATYLIDLPTPEGLMSYDEIFDKGIENIGTTWRTLDIALAGDPTGLHKLGDWNLDTGKDSRSQKHIFWEKS